MQRHGQSTKGNAETWATLHKTENEHKQKKKTQQRR
jgi:hypothetical protein